MGTMKLGTLMSKNSLDGHMLITWNALRPGTLFRWSILHISAQINGINCVSCHLYNLQVLESNVTPIGRVVGVDGSGSGRWMTRAWWLTFIKLGKCFVLGKMPSEVIAPE